MPLTQDITTEDQIVQGSGAAGSPAGGVLSVQGVLGGIDQPITMSPVTSTGTLNSTSGDVHLILAGRQGVSVVFSGTWVGTVAIEINTDPLLGAGIWSQAQVYNVLTPQQTNFTQANGTFIFLNNSGVIAVRVRFSAYTSGTLTANFTATAYQYAIAQTMGSSPAGSVDYGYPVKVGGKYLSTLPTLSSGQRGDIQLDANSRQIIAPVQGQGTAGTPSGGVMTVQGAAAGTQLPTSDTVNTTALDKIISLSTTPVELFVGASRLATRKYVWFEAQSNNVVWGFSSSTQSFDAFKSQLVCFPIGNIPIYAKMTSGTGTISFGEGA